MRRRSRRSSRTFGRLLPVPAPVAQGIEHGSPKAGVACSNHAGGTKVVTFKLASPDAGFLFSRVDESVKLDTVAVSPATSRIVLKGFASSASIVSSSTRIRTKNAWLRRRRSRGAARRYAALAPTPLLGPRRPTLPARLPVRTPTPALAHPRASRRRAGRHRGLLVSQHPPRTPFQTANGSMVSRLRVPAPVLLALPRLSS